MIRFADRRFGVHVPAVLQNDIKEIQRSSAYSGQVGVLFFYPPNFTFVCRDLRFTSSRDARRKFRERGAIVRADRPMRLRAQGLAEGARPARVAPVFTPSPRQHPPAWAGPPRVLIEKEGSPSRASSSSTWTRVLRSMSVNDL